MTRRLSFLDHLRAVFGDERGSIAPPPEAPPAPPPTPPPNASETPPAPAQTSLLTPPADPPVPVDWRLSLPAELKTEKSLESFKDVGALAKAFIETKKLVGQRALKPLTDSSTSEDVAAYRKAFNIPETPEGYFSAGVTRPEIAASAEWDQAAEGQFLAAMHGVHATPAQVQAALHWYGAFEGDKQKAAMRETQAVAQELRREWGPTYDANLGRANRAIQEFGGSDLVERFAATGAGRDPLVVKAFAKIGNALVESGAMEASGLPTSLTPDEARKRIGELRTEMVALPEGHPRTKDLIDEVLALTRVVHRS